MAAGGHGGKDLAGFGNLKTCTGLQDPGRGGSGATLLGHHSLRRLPGQLLTNGLPQGRAVSRSRSSVTGGTEGTGDNRT